MRCQQALLKSNKCSACTWLAAYNSTPGPLEHTLKPPARPALTLLCMRPNETHTSAMRPSSCTITCTCAESMLQNCYCCPGALIVTVSRPGSSHCRSEGVSSSD
jgi:hypothetical protein